MKKTIKVEVITSRLKNEINEKNMWVKDMNNAKRLCQSLSDIESMNNSINNYNKVIYGLEIALNHIKSLSE